MLSKCVWYNRVGCQRPRKQIYGIIVIHSRLVVKRPCIPNCLRTDCLANSAQLSFQRCRIRKSVNGALDNPDAQNNVQRIASMRSRWKQCFHHFHDMHACRGVFHEREAHATHTAYALVGVRCGVQRGAACNQIRYNTVHTALPRPCVLMIAPPTAHTHTYPIGSNAIMRWHNNPNVRTHRSARTRAPSCVTHQHRTRSRTTNRRANAFNMWYNLSVAGDHAHSKFMPKRIAAGSSMLHATWGGHGFDKPHCF